MSESSVQRRLAAILASDVVRCSQLMGEDEESILAILKACREVIDALIGRRGGRVSADGRAGAAIDGQRDAEHWPRPGHVFSDCQPELARDPRC